MSDTDCEWVNGIHQGDAAEALREMPSDSVHMAMCSPPYFGLRDYGVDGQIGLEDSIDEYIQNLVDVGEELRRVLHGDGSWWLNLGDSYAQSGRSNHDKPGTAPDGQGHARGHDAGAFGQKNKMLVPHRVAIALQESGWIVRGDCVWAKPNSMPDPTKDRLTETKEFVFHLTPEPDYWFNLDAIREPYAETTKRDAEAGYGWNDSKLNPSKVEVHGEGGVNDPSSDRSEFMHPDGKNPGDVFEVTTKPFPDAHFAVYPPELCEKPIKATCPEGGIVLDPFAGAGTTCLVAKRLGRRFVGIELNEEYVALAQKRVGIDVDNPEYLVDDGQTTLVQADGGDES